MAAIWKAARVIRRLVDRAGLIFLIVYIWKVALLIFTAQPVPANDSFFYDGPVVNLLLHGKYCNPSLVQALPISGGEVFCAYPPLYQATLLGWMSIFGTSELAAMWFHVFLLGIFFLIVLAIFRRLQVPGVAINVAGLFLFGITFHDRPDTLAHVMGALAVLGVVSGGRRIWLGVAGMVLAYATSLQIGSIYLLWCGLMLLGNAWAGRAKLPWIPMITWGVVVAGLVALVRFGFPLLWTGFQEHVHITPAVAPWHAPHLMDTLKAVRTAPAIFGVAAAIIISMATGQTKISDVRGSLSALVAVCGTLAGLAIISGSLIRFSPNTVHITTYIQPVVVGAFLGSGIFFPRGSLLFRPIVAVVLVCALVTGIRAIGLTTWGVACARDMSREKSLNVVRAAVDPLPAGSTVVASSAYLYELASRTNIAWVHNDWPAVPGDTGWEAQAVARMRAERIIVTQFDYYRRYRVIIEHLRSYTNLVSLNVTNTASVQPPDASPKFMRVIQHVSWAPVVVELKWR